MFTCTDDAATLIRSRVDGANLPDGSGLRLVLNVGTRSWMMSLAAPAARGRRSPRPRRRVRVRRVQRRHPAGSADPARAADRPHAARSTSSMA